MKNNKLIKMSISNAVTSRLDMSTLLLYTRSRGGIIYTGLIHCILYDTMSLSLFNNGRLVMVVPKEYENRVYFSDVLLESKPILYKEHCKNLRSVSRLHKNRVSNNKQSSSPTGNKYKDYTDLAVRNFIKGLFSIPPKYNIVNDFRSYSEIIDFIKEYKKDARISKTSLSNLKNRRMVIKAVPRTEETERFIEYVKTRYKNFDDKTFFALESRLGVNYNNNNNYKTEKLDEFKVKVTNGYNVKDKDTNNTNNKNYYYKFNMKRFFIDAIIFLTPSLILIILLGCYEGSESSYNSHNLHNVVAPHQSVYQNEDSESICNLHKVVAPQQNLNQNTDTSTLSSRNHQVSPDSKIGIIKICSSLVLTIALIVLIFTVFPQDGAEILQKGLGEGPYSPDTLRNTEDILAEIARRKSI